MPPAVEIVTPNRQRGQHKKGRKSSTTNPARRKAQTRCCSWRSLWSKGSKLTAPVQSYWVGPTGDVTRWSTAPIQSRNCRVCLQFSPEPADQNLATPSQALACDGSRPSRSNSSAFLFNFSSYHLRFAPARPSPLSGSTACASQSKLEPCLSACLPACLRTTDQLVPGCLPVHHKVRGPPHTSTSGRPGRTDREMKPSRHMGWMRTYANSQGRPSNPAQTQTLTQTQAKPWRTFWRLRSAMTAFWLALRDCCRRCCSSYSLRWRSDMPASGSTPSPSPPPAASAAAALVPTSAPVCPSVRSMGAAGCSSSAGSGGRRAFSFSSLSRASSSASSSWHGSFCAEYQRLLPQCPLCGAHCVVSIRTSAGAKAIVFQESPFPSLCAKTMKRKKHIRCVEGGF
jgi:hypothetical protein